MWGPCLHVNWRGDNRAIQCKCGEAHNAEDARGLVLYGGNQLCREASAEDPLSGMDKTGRLTLIAMMCAGKKWQSCLVLGRKGKSRGGGWGRELGGQRGKGGLAYGFLIGHCSPRQRATFDCGFCLHPGLQASALTRRRHLASALDS